MGIVEDQANRDALAPLLRFSSSKSGDDTTSLAEYVGRCGDVTGTSTVRHLHSVCMIIWCKPWCRMRTAYAPAAAFMPGLQKNLA